MIMEHNGFSARQVACDIAMGEIYGAFNNRHGVLDMHRMPEEKKREVRRELARLHDEICKAAGLHSPALVAQL